VTQFDLDLETWHKDVLTLSKTLTAVFGPRPSENEAEPKDSVLTLAQVDILAKAIAPVWRMVWTMPGRVAVFTNELARLAALPEDTKDADIVEIPMEVVLGKGYLYLSGSLMESLYALHAILTEVVFAKTDGLTAEDSIIVPSCYVYLLWNAAGRFAQEWEVFCHLRAELAVFEDARNFGS